MDRQLAQTRRQPQYGLARRIDGIAGERLKPGDESFYFDATPKSCAPDISHGLSGRGRTLGPSSRRRPGPTGPRHERLNGGPGLRRDDDLTRMRTSASEQPSFSRWVPPSPAGGRGIFAFARPQLGPA